jgi:hypothetical protein
VLSPTTNDAGQKLIPLFDIQKNRNFRKSTEDENLPEIIFAWSTRPIESDLNRSSVLFLLDTFGNFHRPL